MIQKKNSTDADAPIFLHENCAKAMVNPIFRSRYKWRLMEVYFKGKSLHWFLYVILHPPKEPVRIVVTSTLYIDCVKIPLYLSFSIDTNQLSNKISYLWIDSTNVPSFRG